MSEPPAVFCLIKVVFFILVVFFPKGDNKSYNFNSDWTSERRTVVSSAYCASLSSLCSSIGIPPFISFQLLILFASNSVAITNGVPENSSHHELRPKSILDFENCVTSNIALIMVLIKGNVHRL